MDFVELEAMEGLRWAWNAWPASKAEAAALPIPLSVMCTPLNSDSDSMELPKVEYEPLICTRCGAALNPYARVDYQSKTWICAFCALKNSFPKSYVGIGEHNLPAELFPTYCTVEYCPPSVDPQGVGPGFVFVVDLCTPEEELRALKQELLRVVSLLPENVLVGLVTFDSMVRVYDLSFADHSRVFLFRGDRDLSSYQIQQFLRLQSLKQPYLGKPVAFQKQGFLLTVSECEFIITTAIEEIHSSGVLVPGLRPFRATGTAISVAVGLLEGFMGKSGSRVIVFTSGSATIGSGIVVEPIQSEVTVT